MKFRTFARMFMVSVLAFSLLTYCGGDDGGSGNGGSDKDTAGEEDTSGGDTGGGDSTECTPVCEAEGYVCGPDGCGAVCGTCEDGVQCVNGHCDVCEPMCEGKVCGDDGCGGSCGDCVEGEACTDGACVPCEKQCDGKACGPDGCGGVCGECEAGFECQLDGSCAEKVGGLGAYCGQDDECRRPDQADPDYDALLQEYFDCTNAQCGGGQYICFSPYCTRTCKISKDELNNTTGEPGADGIEDPDAPSNDCGDAAEGLVGTNFRCAKGWDGTIITTICYPGTDLKECSANADCSEGETCGLVYANNTYESRCITAIKDSTDEVAAPCNDDPIADDYMQCDNGLCFGVGCTQYCASDDNCMTGGTCEAGACSGNADFACTADSDCSAWECTYMEIYGEEGVGDDICFPKNCMKHAECPDDAFICQPFISDEQDKFEGSCMMRPEGSVDMGEACDEDPEDNIPGDTCSTDWLCIGGYCGGICTGDADCATDKDQQCVVIFEYDYDADEDGNADAYLPLWSCMTFPGFEGECWTDAECADGKVCQLYETGPAAGELYMTGTCVDSPDEGVFGDLCGSAVGEYCNSGWCWGAEEESAGYCTQTCNQQSDCPETVQIPVDETEDGELIYETFKTVCRSYMYGWNGTEDQGDDLFIGFCNLAAEEDPLTDCSTDFTCGEGEMCMPFAILSNPDVAGHMDYLCIAAGEESTIPVGGECVPDPAEDYEGPYCATGLCMPGVEADKGYCSTLCAGADDESCLTLGADFVCNPYMWIDRPGEEFDLTLPQCQMAATCITCETSDDCVPGYDCVNVGGLGFTADYRCAPSCAADGDCAGTDGGDTCKESKDKVGEGEGVMACMPPVNTCL